MNRATTALRMGEPVHVVFLHNKFKKRPSDRYILDMAAAIEQQGHTVSIVASDIEEDNCFADVIDSRSNFNISFCGWWLPSNWKFLRSAIMALRMVLFPPTPLPAIVIMDVKPIALYILSVLSNFKLIYVTNFSFLQQIDAMTDYTTLTQDLITANALKRADEIIVPSECIAEVLRRSYPLIRKELKIVHPCVDTGLWRDDHPVNITRIIPNVPKPIFMFVCFGSYKKRSNFKLVLQAFEELLLISPSNIKNKIHLVIADHCDEVLPEQQLLYYRELQDCIKERKSASQVTFLKHLPTGSKKTLIEECIGVIMPCKHELFPDTILAVLASSKPIIATNFGFAKEALRHRISALLVDPTPQLFAAAMYKVLTNPTVQVFLGDMGHDLFIKRYCYAVFKRKINCIVRQNVETNGQILKKLE